jgi:hypothetical protein
MGQRSIRLTGAPAAAAVLFVAALFLGNFFVPRLLAATGLRTGYTVRLWNSGHIERYVDSEGGGLFTGSHKSYRMGRFYASEGDRLSIEYDATVNGGSAVVYLWSYRWGLLYDSIGWSQGIAAGQHRLSTVIPASGVYGLQLSMSAFGGSVDLDWSVE